ncbi:MAG: copper transporter [Patescibacteria group bacterium]
MIIDLRYHVASLIAVFLALGMGILIGGALLGNATLQKELNQIEQSLARMREDQHALEAEIVERDGQIRVYQQFSQSVLPVLIRERLAGKRVALVRTNPHTDQRLAKDLARLLALAGAKAVTTTTIVRNPADLTPDRLAVIGGKLGLAAGDHQSLARGILAILTDRIINGPDPSSPILQQALSVLAGARLIETAGDYGEMVDILILCGGSLDPAFDSSQQVDRALIETAVDNKGLVVAAVEPGNAARSYLAEYLQHPIIAIDNVETTPGKAALILALAQGKKAHYGFKGTRQLLPSGI